jgi:signal transduction histidine kinase/FixJ family two-component response regulator
MVNPDPTPLVALLIEDDPADAALLALRLESANHTVGVRPTRLVQASSMSAACAALASSGVDIVILDLTLPDARGLEALHRVRAASPRTPVIVLTGLADQKIALEALRAGAQDYVLKPPPDGPSLSRIVGFACERHRLLQQLDGGLRKTAVAERQWRLLAEIGSALAMADDPKVAIARVAELVVPDVADGFVLYLAGDDESPIPVELWHVLGERAPALREGVQAIIRENGSDALRSTPWKQALKPLLASLGLASGDAVVLYFGGLARGLLVLACMPERHDDVTDTRFTRLVSERIGIAFDRDRMLRHTQLAVAARDRAVSVVSHDLRNPLTTIQICATALLDPTPPPPGGVRHMGELILRSAAWMHQIVDDLLDRASLDAGRLALHRKPTDVSEVMFSARLLFASIAEQRDIELVLNSAPSLPWIDVDPRRLLQALSNLISNAMKFTPAGGRVEISAKESYEELVDTTAARGAGGAVRFTISDTGPGIPPEDLAHVFEWFWRSPRGTQGGAGLGLAIAKGLIEAHRGRLHVESVPGRGSTFWFTLPAATGQAQSRREMGARLA